MARLGMESLPKPRGRYRVDRHAPGLLEGPAFESNRQCDDEDIFRRNALLRSLNLLPVDQRRLAMNLARRLDYSNDWAPPPPSLASSAHMRDLRIKVGGALWQLFDDKQFGEPAAFTIIPRSWECTPDELHRMDPRKLLGSLRTDLNRRSAGDADGYFVGFIHGEYASNQGVLRLHAHGLAAGGMIGVIDSLRNGRNYCSDRSAGRNPDDVWQRIVVSRKPLTDVPAPLTYMLKSYWLARYVGEVGDYGEIKRSWRGQRLPEPVHSQVLLWFDRWSLNDFSLLLKVRVGPGGFQLTTP